MSINYKDIKSEILTRITKGDLPPGALVPNEVELAESYGCARATVNRAMRELTDEGILERRRKAGTRVRMAPLREARFSIPVVREEIEGQAASYGYTLLNRQILHAPDWLRERLKLVVGDDVLHLTCLHRADNAPYQLEDRWINLARFPQAAGVDFAASGPNEWLISTVPFSDVEMSFGAAAATAAQANYLGCTTGDALFEAERSTWWEGRAVTFVRLTYPPGYRMTTRY